MLIVLSALGGLYLLGTSTMCVSVYKSEKKYTSTAVIHNSEGEVVPNKMPGVGTYLAILLLGPFLIVAGLFALVSQLKKHG